jgi:NitT/TauT family transport system substrate-binding protein
MMVNTATLKDNPDFGKALVGAWYEMMGIMSKDDDAGKAARTAMAVASGTDLAGYDAQLATTQMFYTPADAVKFTQSEALPKTMTFVAKFLFDHGILGEGAPSADYVGVAYPGGEVTGDANNVKLRYDTTYMEMAAGGGL